MLRSLISYRFKCSIVLHLKNRMTSSVATNDDAGNIFRVEAEAKAISRKSCAYSDSVADLQILRTIVETNQSSVVVLRGRTKKIHESQV